MELLCHSKLSEISCISNPSNNSFTFVCMSLGRERRLLPASFHAPKASPSLIIATSRIQTFNFMTIQELQDQIQKLVYSKDYELQPGTSIPLYPDKYHEIEKEVKLLCKRLKQLRKYVNPN